MKTIATKNCASQLALLAILAPAAYAQAADVVGISGGSQTSTDCGFIPDRPDYSFTVSQQITSISIEVSGSNDYTLLALGPEGTRECILAHDFDGGKIHSRGLYKAGIYNLYIGDMDGSGDTFTLTVKQQ